MPDSVGNVLTLTSKGDIGADFAGHVHASGLDLDLAMGGAVLQDVNRIQWKRVADGVARGGLYATQLFGDTAAILDTYALSPLNASHHADVIVHADDAGGVNNRVDVQADTWQRTLIDAAGGSDYLRSEGFAGVSNNGALTGANWPGPGNGFSFVARGTKALVLCSQTAYTATGADVVVDVQVDGAFIGNMYSAAANVVNARINLIPLHFTQATTPGTTYWIWFKLFAGATGPTDRGIITVIQ